MSANSTEFPAAQKARLLELLPEYETYISEKNPDHHPRCKALLDWRKDKAKALMEEPLFQDLVEDRNAEVAAWELVCTLLFSSYTLLMHSKAIRHYFTNYYNNKLLRNEVKATTRNTASASSATQNGNTSSPVDNLLSCAIVTFLGDLSAREMFASENEDAVRTKMDELRVDYPKIPAGALRGKAVKHLWHAADHAVWDEKIKALAQNVDAYVPLSFTFEFN